MGGTELFKLFGTIALDGVDETNNEIKEVTGNAEKSSDRMTSAFKKIGAAVATYFTVDTIVNFGKACVTASAEIAAEEAAFAQIMGEYSGEAQKKINKIADATGITNSRLTPYMTSMTAKFKGLGYGVNDATGYAQRGLTLAADASAFWDKSLDESMSHLNSFINGSYEGGEAIGLFANDTQMAMYAVEQGLVKETKEWSKLDEATKQATRLEYAENMMKQSGAVGQAAKESGAYANVQANLNEAWRQFKANVGEPILQNLVIPAMQKLTGILPTLSEKVNVVIEKVKEMWKWYKENETIINTVVIAIGAFVGALTLMNSVNKVIGWVKNLISTFKTLYALMMANPIGLIVAAIAALVAAFLYLWNNCEGFRNFWKNLWNGIKNIFSSVANWIKNTIEKIKNWFSDGWNKIKTKTTETWNGIKTGVTDAINKVKSVITNVFNSVKNFVTNVWNGIKNGISNAINGAKTAVSNVINGIKNTVSNVFNSIKTTASNVWNGIKDAIMKPIESAKEKVKTVIDKIKGFFSFKISWPKIPMPHFGISPKGWKIGDLLKGSIPKLNIDWYAKGAILDKPTIFGVNGSNLMVGGEAGKEAVAPISTLQAYVKDAVRSEMGLMETYLYRLVETIDKYLPEAAANKNLVLDTGALVGAMTSNIDYAMGNINRRKERGG